MANLIDSITAQMLTDAGFERMGKKKRWTESEGKVTRIIDIEKPTRSDHRFINLGVWFSEIEPMPLRDRLTSSSGQITGRAQDVLSEADEKQLDAASHVRTQMAEPERQEAIEHALVAVLEFLRSFDDLESYRLVRGKHRGVLEHVSVSKHDA